ncbi:MAG TPA: WD40 repeat domain-containing protein [Gemmataceae bacterium]|jgi:WD40 repeat protein
MHQSKRIAAFILLAFLFATESAPAQPSDVPKSLTDKAGKTDLYGDPLPSGAIARLGTVRLRHGDGVYSVVFSADGKTLASSGADEMIRLWDVPTGRESRHIEGRFEDLVFCKERRSLAMTVRGGAPTRWDIGSAKLVPMRAPVKGVTDSAFSPDGKILAGALPNKAILLWDAATGNEIHRLTGHSEEVLTLVFSPDGKKLASGSNLDDGTVRAWDVESKRQLRQFGKPRMDLTPLGFSPDGKILTVRNDRNAIVLWDVESGKQVRRLDEERGLSVRSAAFTSDGRILASGARDYKHGRLWVDSIRLWQVSTGKNLRRFTTLGQVNVVTFSPDDKLLAVAGWGNTIHLFDVRNGKELFTERGHLETVAE